MEEDRDKNAFAEVDEIINNLSEKTISKIPKSFIEFLKENKNLNHNFVFDKNKTIDEQNILEETKIIIAIIYRDFICTKEEKQKLNEILEKNEIKYQKELEQKYSPKNIFQSEKRLNNTTNITTNEKNELIIPNEGLWKKILRKIMTIFK